MNKKLILAVLLAVLAPVIWLGSGGGPAWSNNNLGLGQKLAGGWLATLELAGEPVEAMFSLTADGGFIMNGTLRPWDVETGGWLGTRYNTTAHGSWTRTGPSSIQVGALLFVQDYNGETVLYEPVRVDLTLDRQGRTLEGRAEVQLIWADTDPLNPDPSKVLVTLPASATARRIQ